jgi:hypothetical protein
MVLTKRAVGTGRGVLFAGAVLCCVAGCGDRDEGLAQSMELLAPAVVKRQLVLVAPEHGWSLWLNAGADTPKARVVERSVPRTPILVEKRRAADELLLLCRRPESDTTDFGGELVVLDADGIDRSYRLGARYNRMTQSDDGRFAFVSTTQGDESADTLYFNPDDVSIVDLDEEPGQNNPSQRTLSGDGEPLSQIFVSSDFEIGGEQRRLGVVLFQSRLSLLDLSHPGRAEWTAQLAGADAAGGGIGLEQVLFVAEEHSIYLRGRQARDVYVLGLTSKEPEGENGNDFGILLNQLGAGQPISDLELVAADRLVATTYQNTLLVVDTGSAKLTSITLPAQATSILPFVAEAEGGSERSEVLLYAAGQRVITFVLLEGLQERKDRNLEAVTLPGGVESVTELDNNQLLITHTQTGLSVLDLNTRRVSPISSPVHLTKESVLVDADHGRIWLAAPGQNRVGSFDLSGLQPQQTKLDAVVQYARLVQGSDRHKLVIVHPSQLGYMTILDADKPERQTAVSLRGYLFDGVLDRGED